MRILKGVSEMSKKSSRPIIVLLFVSVVFVSHLTGCKNGDSSTNAPASNPHNVLLEGPWFFFTPAYPDIEGNFFVFDGMGGIVDGGGISAASPLGTYSMNADSSGTMYLNYIGDPQIVVSMQLTSGTQGTGTGTVSGQQINGTMEKILDSGLMVGTWAGEIVVFGQDLPCTLDVDNTGIVTRCVGFPAPADGRAYSNASGLAMAIVRTSHTGAYHDIFFHTGTVVNESWTGELGVDQTGGDGTFTFVRE